MSTHHFMHIRAATPADAVGIAHVHVESWRTTYCGIVPQLYLDALSETQRAEFWRGCLTGDPRYAAFAGTLVLVAEDDGHRIVGFASGGDQKGAHPPYDGELYTIYLLEAVQRRGIGRRLITSIAGGLHERGIRSLLLWVLAENPACAFYERLGGTRAFEREVAIGGRKLAEVGFGWPDVSALLSHAGR